MKIRTLIADVAKRIEKQGAYRYTVTDKPLSVKIAEALKKRFNFQLEGQTIIFVAPRKQQAEPVETKTPFQFRGIGNAKALAKAVLSHPEGVIYQPVTETGCAIMHTVAAIKGVEATEHAEGILLRKAA